MSRSDNDVYGHINNSVYAFLIDSITNAYLVERCGRNPKTSEEHGTGIVVSSYCDFFGSISYPAVVQLGLRVVKLGKTSVLYEVGVFEEGQEPVKAVGGFVHVFCHRDSSGNKPLKEGMPDQVKKGLRILLEINPEKAKLWNRSNKL